MTSALLGGVALRGIAAAVPTLQSPLSDEIERFGAEAVEKVASSTGIRNRRVASAGLSTADLCEAAGRRLLNDLGWDPTSVGLVILVTQTPEFELPASACVLQDRLGLGKDTAALDVNLGCSSYAYGLWLASSLLKSMPQGRALVLVGDTLTKRVDRTDRALWPLFGDAGTATALERDDQAPDMSFDVGTDGSGWRHLVIRRGDDGAATPSETLHMDGPAVFSFTLREVPPMVKRLTTAAGASLDEVDYVVFHQANEFILRNLQKRLKVPDEKFIVDLAQWGNTSGATIPLAIVSSLREQLTRRRHRLLLAGFGVGLSWSSVLLDVDPSVVIPPVVEVDEPTSDASE